MMPGARRRRLLDGPVWTLVASAWMERATGTRAWLRHRRLRLPLLRHSYRTVDIGQLQDTFLLAAVATIITIRLQLWATNYPKLGGGGLHIAHLLWGGLFMMIALGIAISFLGRTWRRPAAFLGGVGFGFFIDELGKFVTEDNNYFFKPTAVMIYLIFILLYLGTRWMQKGRKFSPRENLFNAIDYFADAVSHDFDVGEKKRALELLDGSGDDPLVEPLRRLVLQTDAIPVREPGRLRRGGLALRRRYFRIVEKRWFVTAVTWIFGIWAFGILLQVLVLVLALGLKIGGAQAGFQQDEIFDLPPANIASIASSAIAGYFMVRGVRRLRRGDRLGAYDMLDRALMVQIFITQVFIFVESSFSAVSGLLVSILMLVTIRYAKRKEHERDRGDVPEADLPAARAIPEPAPAPAA